MTRRPDEPREPMTREALRTAIIIAGAVLAIVGGLWLIWQSC